MELKQISVSIENSHGRLFEISNALANANINLRALNLVDTGDFGILRLLVSNVAEARHILMGMQMPARIDYVLAVRIEDYPGSFAKLMKCFLHTEIKVIYTYSLTKFIQGATVMIFRFNDNEKAIEILKENNFELMDTKSFDIIE